MIAPHTAPPALASGVIYAAGRRDMTCRQLALLHAIAEKPGYSTREYAATLGFHRPAVTRACDVLIEFGYARREEDIKDRRLVRMFATAAGKRLLEGRAS